MKQVHFRDDFGTVHFSMTGKALRALCKLISGGKVTTAPVTCKHCKEKRARLAEESALLLDVLSRKVSK